MTGIEDDATGLFYPFEGRTPAPGEVLEVADGVWWVRLDLPFKLNHINVWVLRDGDGYAVIDTGLHMDTTKAAWERILGELFPGGRLTKLIVTHMHPDHVGLAGWFCERSGAPLFMSRTDYLFCRVLVADTGKPAPSEGIAFYKRAGFNAQAIADYVERFGMFGLAVGPMPESFTRLADGDEIDIGGAAWRVISGGGHSPEHLSFHSPERGIYIAGDQVLPRITSNVSVWPTEPLADPLFDWIASCHKQRALVPDDVLVLPSHNEPFRGLHRRLDDLIAGHEAALVRLHELLGEPKRAVDVFSALFKREVGRSLLVMATGEAVAHLNYVNARGLATVEDVDGVAWYRRTAAQLDRDRLMPERLTWAGLRRAA